MSVSKSRRPKADRVARELADELQPDPADYYASARYIDRRAELGDFSAKGTPNTALAVLHYLWRHTVRNVAGLGPKEVENFVLSGKRKLGKIAAECGISYNTASNVIDWLVAEKWIETEKPDGSQEFDIWVRMDSYGHEARLKLHGKTVTTVGTVTTDRANDCDGLPQSLARSVPTVVTASPNGWDTLQGNTQGPQKDHNDDGGSPSGKTQSQDPGLDDSPSAEELRATFLAGMASHASPETAIRPHQLSEELGLGMWAFTRPDIPDIIGSLRDEGVIAPCDAGWYLVAGPA